MGSDARLVRGAAQKEPVKAFESLCGRHGRWEVWADWIVMCACSISNAVDRVHREKREETYLTLCKKYTEAEMQTMGEMFGMVVAALDENPDQDLLGEIFMTLGLGNEHNGQFFTPYNVCSAMSALNSENIAAQVERQGWVPVADPACGAGALLVAFANECLRQKVNYQTSVLFVAQDIDFTVGLMCYIQLSLLGCAGYVVIGDTLAHPATDYDRRGLIPRDEGNVWYTPMYFRDVWHWRRVWAQVDMMCKASQGPEEHQNPPAPEEPPERPCKGGKGESRKNAEDDLKRRPQPPDFSANEYGQLTLF